MASLVAEHGLSVCGLQQLRPLGSRAQAQLSWCMGLVAPQACGVFLDQRLNLCPLHWQSDSLSTGPPGMSPQHVSWPIEANQSKTKSFNFSNDRTELIEKSVSENRTRNGLLYVRIKTFRNDLDVFIPGRSQEGSQEASEPCSRVDFFHKDHASHPVGAQWALSERFYLLYAMWVNDSAFPSNSTAYNNSDEFLD